MELATDETALTHIVEVMVIIGYLSHLVVTGHYCLSSDV